MGTPGTTITLLGRVAVGGDGVEVGPRGRRAELVFAHLAAEHRRFVTQDELADALWPAGLPTTWEPGLRGVLTEVRRLLADGGLDPAWLVTGRRGYQLQLPDDVRVDLDDARDALAAARTLLADGAGPAAAERAARAAELARLPFLPNHDGEWVAGVRRELATTTARALEVAVQAHDLAGDLGAAAAAAERLVRAEPFNEVAHQLRIGILGRAGDRSGAIRAYEHCRDVLAAELGVAPSAATTAVLRVATGPAEVPAPPAGAAAPGPAPATSSPAEGHGGLGGLAVLVVEDHAFQRRTAVMLLRNLGVGHVDEADDGAAALRVLGGGSARPDVILCDLDMPGMDGVEFIRHVAEGELADAVIIASALDAKVIHAVQAVGEGYGLRILGTIEKPVTARRLGELLAAHRPRPRPAATAEGDDGGPPVTAYEVETALADGSITFHLQPGVDVATGRVAAVDAVPRWHDPGRGWVAPERFVPVLGRAGRLGDLSARGLALVCALLGGAGRELDVAASVDLAVDGLGDPALADRAAAVVRDAGVDPARVTFELDQRAFRDAPGAALGALTRLRVKGFGVSLDGFGAGRAPADRLRAVPLTEVKLAPGLVAGAAVDPARARALEEAVDVGRELGATVVGDGCASDADLGLLLALGCDRVQGPLVADPVPGAELAAWVAAWDPDRLGEGRRA